RLDTLMKTQAIVAQRRPAWWLVPILVLCGLLAGVMLASAMKPKPLLEGSQSPVPEVPRMQTVAGQLMYAEMQKSEKAWKAVPEYFPPSKNAENRQAAYKAEKGLADFYLLEGRLSDAMVLYQELTNVDPAESQIRAQGHAG